MTNGISTVTSDFPQMESQTPVDGLPPAVVEPPAADNPTPPASDQAPTDDQSGKDTTPPWLKAEITKERNRRRAAEEETAQLKAQVDRLTKAIGERKPEEPADTRPRREDFFDPDEYEAAKDQWVLEQATERAAARLREEQTRTSTEQAQARYIEELRTAWTAQVERAEAAHPDFNDVVYADDFHCSGPALQTLVEMEDGAEITYQIASDPEAKARFSKLSPGRQIAEIGRRSAALEAKPPTVSRAPAPISPLGNEAPAIRKDPAEQSEAEYFAERAARAKATGERMY